MKVLFSEFDFIDLEWDLGIYNLKYYIVSFKVQLGMRDKNYNFYLFCLCFL